ncbi:MAG: tetratricopeptide repeat protein [Candidatus Aegiribacteria sp.]|nr:tetratricopeptide repeat protein [Candidatus Aegiribacteria sp.]
MTGWNLNRKIILTVVAISAVLAACSSPAVTGMKVHMQNQEYDEIIHLADSVIARGDSLNAEIWFWRGKALTEKKQWPEAAESFMKAYELDADGALAINEYWFVFFNSAANTMDTGDIGSAVEMLNIGMLVAPERPDFELMLGDVELNRNSDLPAALGNYRNASQKAEALMASLQQMIDDTSDPYMLDYYTQNLAQTRNLFIQAIYNSGSILTMMALDATEEDMLEYLHQAKDVYGKALEVDPTNVDMLDALAGTYLLEGDYESAIAIFDQAFINIGLGLEEGWLEEDEANGIMANMLVSKGYAYIEMENYQQSIIELNSARELIGDDFIVLSTLAHANFVMENYDESLSILDSVVMIEGLTPDELANAYYTRYACFNRKELDSEAVEALETALDFDPGNANYWRYLASTYSRLGRRNDAINAMQKAEDLDSLND